MEEIKSLESVSFEESLAELEAIVDRLESGQGSLDEAIKAYERGSELKRHCQKKLDEARMKVEQTENWPGLVSSSYSKSGESH